MAAVTPFAKRTPMQVITAVARCAAVVGIVKCHGGMALQAGDIGVRADQRETCDVMIKPKLRDPARRNMTRFTTFTELAKVQVIVGVAQTTGFGQCMFEFVGMAGLARQVAVTGRQGEAGFALVVEMG